MNGKISEKLAESLPSDIRAPKFPVSVKGIVFCDGKVVLLKNERDEWELPGGKLEFGETPEECVCREIHEELGVTTRTVSLQDCWIYNIEGKIEVLIVTFGCLPIDGQRLICSHEHKEARLFELQDLHELRIPEGYRKSIIRWAELAKPLSSAIPA